MPATAQVSHIISSPAELDRLAAVRPDPRWSPRQKSEAQEISRAAANLSAAIRKLDTVQRKLAAARGTGPRSGLQNEIAVLERELEQARRMQSTAFQNYDQKANQLMQTLIKMMKAMSESRGLGAGSKSGL